MSYISFLIPCATILVSFVLSLALTSLVKRALLQRALLDIPNDRSSHKIPVPRGGGWALLIILLPTLLGAALYIDQDARHLGLIAAIILLAGVSWLDDSQGVSPAMRLSLHLTAACLGSLCFAPTEMLFGGALPFWLDRTLLIVGWAWFINLYNFMDGIDGITATETISITTGLCLVMNAAGMNDPFIGFLALILTGCCLGFLAYNWHPAQIFLGDVGSVPLGFLIGFGLLSLAVNGHLIAALILPLYYLADSGITITKRAFRGEKVWQAHREHFYQHAAQEVGRHDKVVVWIALANIALIAAAIGAISYAWAALTASILIVAILLRKMHKTASI